MSEYPDWFYQNKFPEEIQTTHIDHDAVEGVITNLITDMLGKQLKDKPRWHVVSTGSQIGVFAPTTKDNHKFGVKHVRFLIQVQQISVLDEHLIREGRKK